MSDSMLSGTVTFLFTDVEGSTRLWESYAEEMGVALGRHDEILREAIESHAGHVFKTVGDAFCAVFADPRCAVESALKVQRAIDEVFLGVRPDSIKLRVRIALHTGVAESRDGDYFGQTLNRVARLLAIGHGGQTLLSSVTQELVRDVLPTDSLLRDMGDHRLKDLGRPERVYQLCHKELTGEFPPLRSLDNPLLKHNLPLQLTSFVGREIELAKITELIDKSRLVTLTGSGGSGKTRLAVQVGAELLDGNGDGVWLVELAALRDPTVLFRTVAETLGLHEDPGSSIEKTLIGYLGRKRLLLILDNCEHLLDSSARFADSVLRECPKVQILATSREGLGIAGEVMFRVPSLSLPDPRRDISPRSLYTFESVRLFVERASLVQPEFDVTASNARALASVCCRLDGIPLAIELAAARVRAMPIEQIEQRLDQRFRLLTGGSRTALPRQQTLQSLIDWSYDLLNDPEQTMLCRLSVFSGGCTIAAAEEVCSGGLVDPHEVLDLLTSLVDKSLVNYIADDTDGRYRLLETVRQYARTKLDESKESSEVRARHRDFFLAMAEESEPQLKGSNAPVWLERLEAEHDNLRASLDWSLGDENAENCLRLCASLRRFWSIRGYSTQGREWCEQALAMPVSVQSLSARALACNAMGLLASDQGDFVIGESLLEEGLRIHRVTGNRSESAVSLSGLGIIHFRRGDFARARKLHEESLIIRRELGDHWGISATLNNLGIVAASEGDFLSARTFYEESLVINRDIGERRGIAISLSNSGEAAFNLGDLDYAKTLYEESLSFSMEIGDRWGIALTLNKLGEVALHQGDQDLARSNCEESLRILRDTKDKRAVTETLETMAALECKQAHSVRSAQLWGAAEGLREEMGNPSTPFEKQRFDKLISPAREALGDEAFAHARDEGRAMTALQAIDLALSISEDCR